VKRIPGPAVFPKDHGPNPRLARKLPGELEPDRITRSYGVVREQVVDPLVIYDREVTPLRQIEAQHADRAVPHPIHRPVGSEVLKREDENRMPGVDAGRRRLGPKSCKAECADERKGADRCDRKPRA